MKLTWDNVNFNSCTITINSANKGGPPRRAVFVRPELLEKLKQWKKEDEGLNTKYVINYKGKKINRLKTAWWNALSRAGIRPKLKALELKKPIAKNRRRIRMYDLRHLFISMLLDVGTDPKTVSEVVGSSPATIMKHYRHTSIAAQKRAIMQIDPVIPVE